MTKSVSRTWLAVVMAVSAWVMPSAAVEVPLLSDLRKPVEVVEETEEEPILPVSVSPERRVAELSRITPTEAVWYVSVPDAKRLAQDWNTNPLGELMDEPSMVRTFRNNRFGLRYLFDDLPSSIISPERIAAMASVLDLADVWSELCEKMAMAAYIDDRGDFQFLFLFDIGLDRVPAFEILTEWETSFFVAHPGSDVQRGDHAGNFLDVWRLKTVNPGQRRAEIAAGFAENVAVISNSATLAAQCSQLLNGGDSLHDSHWGQRLVASTTNSNTADAIAFVRMDALLKGLEHTPIARDSVAAWGDLIGRGDYNGKAIYYGVQFAPDGVRETFMLPTVGPVGSASLVELVSKRLRPAAEWTSPQVIPYQPNPSLFIAAMMDGRQLGGLLRQERRLFGLSDRADAFEVPEAVRQMFSNEIVTLLTGEIGLAFFPTMDGKSQWLMVLPCSGNPESLFRRVESSVERGGATIRSADQDWRNNPSWMGVSPATFRRMDNNYLLVASAGDLLIAAADQLVSGSSFAANRDFVRSLARTEAEQGMLFYINVPEILVREYPNLSQLMRSLYPRSSGLNSRPPLALLRRHAKGLLGVIAPVVENAEFTRVTVQSPVPSLGVLAGSMLLGFPRSLRADGRVDMIRSRENLQNIWLRLQLYSSRFGHFPDSLEDLSADMRMNTADGEIQELLTAPAALARLDPAQAAVGSYRFLSGVTPNDEPDIPLVYEAEPWSEDFEGMYPRDPNRAPAENGEYVPFRQYIRLDGQVVVTPEKRFQSRVVSRLEERE